MPTVSDFVIQRMIDWGVSRIFGFPGDGVGAFDGALGRADREALPISYIRPTHEEICALMATAHAKFTGEVGVYTATSSPGAVSHVKWAVRRADGQSAGCGDCRAAGA